MTRKKTIIKEIYDDQLKEKAYLEKTLLDYSSKIKELNVFIESVIKSEDYDFKVFSPRDAESVHKESLKEKRREKQEYEEKYNILAKKLNDMDKKITGLDELYEDTDEIKALEIQEKERQRIARDLHDSSLQNLTHLVHKIELSKKYIDSDPIQAKLELASVIKGLRSTIDDIRNTVFDLRPMHLEDLGLREAIEQLVEKMQDHSETIVKCDIDEIQYTEMAKLGIYRIVQELLVNAIKYSKAQYIDVMIKNKGDDILIKVEDDGIGFDVKKARNSIEGRHFGLSIMEERVQIFGGKTDIRSQCGEGAAIEIYIPVERLTE